jgi:hypothetical protein
MSILRKVLRLAQDLDNKGLSKEADLLDKFAHSLSEDTERSIGESAASTKRSLEWMDEELYSEMFTELFKHNKFVEKMETDEAAKAAITTINNLTEDLKDIPDPTDEERASAEMLGQERPEALYN